MASHEKNRVIRNQLRDVLIIVDVDHRREGMSELGGEFRQVEQVATYVTFGGGCGTLPEVCRNFAGTFLGGCVTLPELLEGVQNLAGTYLTELAELCRNFVARTSDHCSGTIAELVVTLPELWRILVQGSCR